jgi:hypothetical protein
VRTMGEWKTELTKERIRTDGNMVGPTRGAGSFSLAACTWERCSCRQPMDAIASDGHAPGGRARRDPPEEGKRFPLKIA